MNHRSQVYVKHVKDTKYALNIRMNNMILVYSFVTYGKNAPLWQ